MRFPCKRAALVLGFFIAECLIARIALRQWGFRFGWIGLTDYDLVLPGVVAFIGYFWCLEKKYGAILLKLNRGGFYFHILFVTVFFIFLFSQQSLDLRSASKLLRLSWFALASLTFFSSFFIWVHPRFYVRKAEIPMLTLSLLLAFSKLIAVHIFSFVWDPMVRITGWASYFGVKIFGGAAEMSFKTDPEHGVFAMLAHPLHVLAIGRGCSGVDGLFLFLGFFVLMTFFMSAVGLIKMGWFSFLLGALAMFCANVTRIVIIYGLSVNLHFFHIPDTLRNQIIHHVHTYGGWILYSVILIIFAVPQLDEARSLSRRALQLELGTV